MTTRSIGGRSSNAMPGGTTRRGPMNPTGLARFDHWGSVRRLTPSIWTRTVEWPTHVTVGVPDPRRARASVGASGNPAGREKVEDRIRGITHLHRVQQSGRA